MILNMLTRYARTQFVNPDLGVSICWSYFCKVVINSRQTETAVTPLHFFLSLALPLSEAVLGLYLCMDYI